MSADMGISPYSSESENSFIYRVLFSGLGQWCLSISAGSQNGSPGTTKHNQTLILNNLISKYCEDLVINNFFCPKSETNKF